MFSVRKPLGYRPRKQQFIGRRADKKVKEGKLEEQQKLKPKAKCEEAELKNSFFFKYLGSTFSADGSHRRDVEQRSAMAKNRCGELRHVFGSKDIPLALKLNLYKVAVSSIFTYGSEAWRLTERTMATINGTNATCLSWITNKTAHEEASEKTRTYDLNKAIRDRRHKWIVHIM